jgi:hypothetical protein
MFDINIHVVIFTIDIKNNKKYVLSTNKDSINLPQMKVDQQTKKNIDRSICEFIRQKYLFLSDYEILPQFVSFHSETLSQRADSIDIVYGSIVPSDCQKNDKDCYWVEFNIADPENSEESYLMMNVIRSLT